MHAHSNVQIINLSSKICVSVSYVSVRNSSVCSSMLQCVAVWLHQHPRWQRGEGVQGEGQRGAMHVQRRAWGIQPMMKWAGQVDDATAEL